MPVKEVRKRYGLGLELEVMGYQWYVVHEGMINFYHVGMWKELGEMFQCKQSHYVSKTNEMVNGCVKKNVYSLPYP